MKKNYLLLLALFMVAMCAGAQVSVCGVWPDEQGHFNTSFIIYIFYSIVKLASAHKQ